MVPCTHFQEEAEVDRLASEMETRFDTEFLGYASLLGTIETIFCELATNVVYHASSNGGYVLAQQYKQRDGTVVDVAVADTGIGIRESLRSNPDNPTLTSDTDALELATKEGVSSLRDAHRGFGLSHVTYDLKTDDRRIMTMRSGMGRLVVQGNGKVIKIERAPAYPGTIVSVTIPCEMN